MMCLLATMLALGVGCFAQAPRTIAQQLCDQFDQSLANHDLNQILGFYDPSYVLTDERGNRATFAGVRKELEQDLPKLRRMNQKTTVEDARLEADRMVVNYKSEMHYELRDQRNGWVPQISNSTGEQIWEKKGGHWKLVRSTTFRMDVQVDPKWVEAQKASIDAWRKVVEHGDRSYPR
jgi:hypothetical protein